MWVSDFFVQECFNLYTEVYTGKITKSSEHIADYLVCLLLLENPSEFWTANQTHTVIFPLLKITIAATCLSTRQGLQQRGSNSWVYLVRNNFKANILIRQEN
jgi:hypothetical protein